jgi:hypothetical protein
MQEVFVNKVAESGIITIDLASFLEKQSFAYFDIKEYLFMGLILKEKDFRAALQQADFSIYKGKTVGVHCSADAIIPMWAYMLIASYLQPVAKHVLFANETDLQEKALLHELQVMLNAGEYTDERVVVKGCGDVAIPASAYLSITAALRPYAKSIMFGEPCSTVPIYKKPKQPSV